MIRRPPRSTRTDTLFPYTTLFRSLPLYCFVYSELLGQLRHDLEEIANQTEVRNLKNRRILILVDGDDGLGVLHAGKMLDRAGYADRSEERRVGKECVSTCRSRWSTYH